MTRRIHAILHPSPRPCEHPFRLPSGNVAVCMDCGASVTKFGRN